MVCQNKQDIAVTCVSEASGGCLIILRMHAATDYESSDYLFDKHQVENMKRFVPLGIFFIFAHYSAHKMSNSVRIRVETTHLDNAASPKFPFFTT